MGPLVGCGIKCEGRYTQYLKVSGFQECTTALPPGISAYVTAVSEVRTDPRGAKGFCCYSLRPIAKAEAGPEVSCVLCAGL